MVVLRPVSELRMPDKRNTNQRGSSKDLEQEELMKLIKLHDDYGDVYVNPLDVSSIKEGYDGTTIMMKSGKIVFCKETVDEVVERCIDCE